MVYKKLFHMSFPKCINGLVSDIVNNKNYTVDSSKEYPQYLVYNDKDNSLLPMTEENMNTTDRWNNNIFDALRKIMNFIITLVKNKIAEVNIASIK